MTHTGKIAGPLDNAKAVARLKAFARGAPPPLLERFAERVAQRLLSEFDVPRVRVRVARFGALAGGKVIGVEIERARAD